MLWWCKTQNVSAIWSRFPFLTNFRRSGVGHDFSDVQEYPLFSGKEGRRLATAEAFPSPAAFQRERRTATAGGKWLLAAYSDRTHPKSGTIVLPRLRAAQRQKYFQRMQRKIYTTQ